MDEAWKIITDLQFAARCIKYHRVRLLQMGFAPHEVEDIIRFFVIDDITEESKNGKLDI